MNSREKTQLKKKITKIVQEKQRDILSRPQVMCVKAKKDNYPAFPVDDNPLNVMALYFGSPLDACIELKFFKDAVDKLIDDI